MSKPENNPSPANESPALDRQGNPVKRDDLFVRKATSIGGFNFGEETAEVFDDMLDRSIPLYEELQRMIGEIANEFAQDGTGA